MSVLPALTNLGAEINERHMLAMQHAGKAIEHAIACGKLLIEAKAKAQHGQWLPWLRENVEFSERSAQAYMRIADRVPRQIRNGVADMSVRGVLQHLATPRRHALADLDRDLAEWLEQNEEIKAKRPEPGAWSMEDARVCADSIRGIDSILHRYGLCSEEDCLICSGEARP